MSGNYNNIFIVITFSEISRHQINIPAQTEVIENSLFHWKGHMDVLTKILYLFIAINAEFFFIF